MIMKSSSELHIEYDPSNALYKVEEGDFKYYLPLKYLEELEKYMDNYIATNNHELPSVTAWYNALPRSEKADILVVSRLKGL